VVIIISSFIFFLYHRKNVLEPALKNPPPNTEMDSTYKSNEYQQHLLEEERKILDQQK
jgi:hypothetical protein